MSNQTVNKKALKTILAACSKAKSKKGNVYLWSTTLLLHIVDVIVIQNYQIGVHDGSLKKLDIDKTYETKELHLLDVDEKERVLFEKCRLITSQPTNPVEAFRDGLDLFYPDVLESPCVKKVITMFDKKQLIQSWKTDQNLVCLRNKTVSLLTLQTC